MAGTAPDFLVRFPAPPSEQATVGVGFSVGAEYVLTCAHVVNAALGHDPRRQDKPEPDEIVTLRLPMSGDAIREARVEAWLTLTCFSKPLSSGSPGRSPMPSGNAIAAVRSLSARRESCAALCRSTRSCWR